MAVRGQKPEVNSVQVQVQRAGVERKREHDPEPDHLDGLGHERGGVRVVPAVERVVAAVHGRDRGQHHPAHLLGALGRGLRLRGQREFQPLARHYYHLRLRRRHRPQLLRRLRGRGRKVGLRQLVDSSTLLQDCNAH